MAYIGTCPQDNQVLQDRQVHSCIPAVYTLLRQAVQLDSATRARVGVFAAVVRFTEPLHYAGPSFDEAEVGKFSALAADWWNPKGPLAPLLSMNPVRTKFCRQVMSERFRCVSPTEHTNH